MAICADDRHGPQVVFAWCNAASVSPSTSPLGHKRRFERASAVSALPPFATKSVRAPSAGLGQ